MSNLQILWTSQIYALISKSSMTKWKGREAVQNRANVRKIGEKPGVKIFCEKKMLFEWKRLEKDENIT